MKRPRGDKTSKASRADRQARAVKMMNEGVSSTAIAKALGVSRVTFWRDLQAIEARYVQGSEDDVKQFKRAQYAALTRLEEAVIKGEVPHEVGNTIVRIRDSVAKLLGLNAPTLSYQKRENVNPEHSAEYLLFREACAGLDEVQMQDVYAFAKSIQRNWTPPPIEADFPPPMKALPEVPDATD